MEFFQMSLSCAFFDALTDCENCGYNKENSKTLALHIEGWFHSLKENKTKTNQPKAKTLRQDFM